LTVSNSLPLGWSRQCLGDLFEFKGGGTPNKKNPDYWGGDIPWASVKDIKSQYLTNTIDSITEKGLSESASNLALPGNLVLLTRILPGKVAIVKNMVAVNQDCKIVMPADYVNIDWAYYLFRAIEREFINRASGTTVLGIRLNDVNDIPVALPPLEEQHRIVAKIETLFSELDKGIEALKTAREQLKVYRQAVLKHAFEGKLTAHWREENRVGEWKTAKLGEQLSFLTSGSRGWAAFYANEGDIFIRAQNLKRDRLDLDDVAYVKLPVKSEGKRTRVRTGDLLITITGANVTKTGYVTNDLGTAYVSQHVALCRPVEAMDTEFLYWYLIAEVAGRRQLNDFAYGAGKPGLNLDNIRSVDVLFPEIDEQRQVVQKIKELLSVEENVTFSIDAELIRIETLRQSILKKAFSGQLVPQDPNDEPAAVLLERIRAESGAQNTARKMPKRKLSA
tara:strand:- start:803 stop:2149 length:1347 start_codon:yes stop_codon:yes gene_type:complete